MRNCFHSAFGSLVNGGQSLEISKWEAVLRWIKEDPENRKGSFPKLFKLLNLEILPDDFVKKHIYQESMIKEFHDCESLVLATLCGRDEPLKRIFKTEEATHIIAYHEKSRLLQSYDVETKKWARISRIPLELNQAATDVISLGGDIFVGSGKSVSKFSAGKWTKVFEKSDGQICYCRFASLKECLYLIASNFIVEYNSRANTWKDLKIKLGLGHGFAVAASDDRIFAIGGNDGRTTAKELDPSKTVWEPIASLDFGRKYSSAVFFGGKLFVLGGNIHGRDYPIKVEFYDVNTDTWTTLPDNIQCKNHDFKVFILEGALYTVGGAISGCSDKIVKLELPENIECKPVKFYSTLSCVASLG